MVLQFQLSHMSRCLKIGNKVGSCLMDILNLSTVEHGLKYEVVDFGLLFKTTAL